jgi:hypothetical protein
MYQVSHKRSGHSSTAAPFAFMYTAVDPSNIIYSDTSHPHPVLWRLNYAVACILNWGTDSIKNAAYGGAKIIETREDNQGVETDSSYSEDDEELDEEEERWQISEARAKVCHFVMANFLNIDIVQR